LIGDILFRTAETVARTVIFPDATTLLPCQPGEPKNEAAKVIDVPAVVA
jgi:hypothetical protein